MNTIFLLGAICCVVSRTAAELEGTMDDLFSIFSQSLPQESEKSKDVNIRMIREPSDPFSPNVFPILDVGPPPDPFVFSYDFNPQSTKKTEDESKLLKTLLQKRKKQKPKNKMLLSFTELFLPFPRQVNEKKPFENSIPIFDNVFNDLTPNYHEKLPKRKRHGSENKEPNLKNQILSTPVPQYDVKDSKEILESPNDTRKTSSFWSFEDIMPKFPFFVEEPKTTEHEICKPSDEHCHHNVNEARKIKGGVDRNIILCVVPAVLGLGAIIMCIEMIRKYNDLKRRKLYFSRIEERC